jgi:HAD superfamily hydrolase (TIGR01509 family)
LLKALIFDFDGLILDTETPEMQAWQDIYKQYDQPFSVQSWGQIVGGSGHSDFDPAVHLESLIGHPIDRQAVTQQARQVSNQIILLQPVLPGARELIDRSKREFLALAIASSSPHAWVDNHLKRLGLFEYFDAVLCADDVTITKPDPALYLAALNSLNVKAEEAVVLEDSPNGVLAAKRAGIFSVAVPNPLTIQLNLELADLVLHSLEEVSLDDLKVLLSAN